MGLLKNLLTGRGLRPTANDDFYDVGEDEQSLVVRPQINDQANNPFFPHQKLLTSVTSVDYLGTVAIVNDGAYLQFSNGTSYDYLADSETTVASVTYTVRNAWGEWDRATVYLTIHGANDAPIVNAIVGATNEDGPAATIVADYSDIDVNDVHTFSIDTTGTLGSVTHNGDGTFSYDPNGAFESLAAGDVATDSFTYFVDDGAGGVASNTATITITGQNDAASISGVQVGSVTEDGALLTGDVITVSDVDNGEAKFAVPADLSGTYGAFSFDETGNWTYSLDNAHAAVQALAAGETLTDSLSVTSLDGTASETITVTINGTNDAASISGNAAGSVTEDDTLLAGDTITVSDVDNGEAKFVVPADLNGNYGAFSFTDAGAWAYSLDNAHADVQALGVGDSLTDTLTVTSFDGTASETITVTINGANDAPEAQNDSAVVDENSNVTIDVLANDTDPDANDTKTIIGIGGTPVGTVTNFGTNVFYRTDFQFEYLAEGETATDTFTYTMSDGNGGTDTATVTVTIEGENDDPIPFSMPSSLSHREAPDGRHDEGTGTFLSRHQFTFLEQDLNDTHTINISPTGGGYVGSVVLDLGPTFHSTSSFGNFWGFVISYSVDDADIEHLGEGETIEENYQFTVTDNEGGTFTHAFTHTIFGANDAPELAADTAVAVDENTTLVTYNPVITDLDVNDTHSYAIVGGDDAALFDIDAATGALNFRTAPDFENPADGGTGAGDNVYEVIVQGQDPEGAPSNPIAIAITVNDDPEVPHVIDLTTLSATEGFIVPAEGNGVQAGGSVSGGGDVNGDGYDDLIYGAVWGLGGETGAGEAFVLFGGGGTFGTDVGGRQVIDTSTLSASQGFIIQGDEALDGAGYSVSLGGDINGDGYDDLIVGALSYIYRSPLLRQEGEAYVVFGSGGTFGTDVGGRQVIDLSTLSASQGFIIQGDVLEDEAGFSVSNGGDINGDGYDDVIVGAPRGEDGGASAGEAYVLFGGDGTFGSADGASRQVVDLSTLSASQGFIIQGDASPDRAGRSVSLGGDVNGDGFDDLIVGAPGISGGGEAYVVFGSGSTFGTDVSGRQVMDLSALSASQGFVIQGGVGDGGVGFSASSGGDINGDGYDDLIVSTIGADSGGTDAGATYVLFGSGDAFGGAVFGRQVIDLSTLSSSQGFVIQGDMADDRSGHSVSNGGDFNGDGYDDLIVGAPEGDDGGNQAGEAYLVFGSGGSFGTDVGGRQVIDLSNFLSFQGLIIQGDVAGDFAGYSVSGGGDINGDGYDDLIVGAIFGEDGGTDGGETYVVFGGAFGGNGTPISTTGTAAAEILIGDNGDDVLSGGGGADVIRSGAGDDVITVADTGFFRIDGGTGFDALELDGVGLTLDLDAFRSAISDVELFDLGGNGGTLSIAEAVTVTGLSAQGNELFVSGTAADSVDLGAGFGLAQSNVDALGTGQLFNSYADGGAIVWVDSDVVVV